MKTKLVTIRVAIFYKNYFSPKIIDEKAGPNQVVEIVHHGTSQEEELTPLLDKEHLTLDVKGLVDILEVQVDFIRESPSAAGSY